MSENPHGYDHQAIEQRWQEHWESNRTFRAAGPGDEGFDPDRPKFYVLDMFPYPSGEGLHVGHPEGYTATDIVARYRRMRGQNVLHPMGYDAFGLPAEQYAVRTGVHPAITTRKNIENIRRQIKSLGFSYDWDREVATTDPGYYKWTQWIFMQLYKRGLAYIQEAPVNWCPELGTVLANEEVIDGKSEVGGFPVIRKPMKQWVLKITAYAERLLADIDGVDWPEPIKEMQRNWIGKSVGATVDFPLAGEGGRGDAGTRGRGDEFFDRRRKEGPPERPGDDVIRVFTTRPDTLFGATYMVLAPEHPLVEKLTTDEQREAVTAYVAEAARKSDLQRTDLAKDKTGVFTGGYAINPVNREPIPVWVADYVLISYGTGAIMAVPAHDERDWEFAEKFGLPIPVVVKPAGRELEDGECFTGQGVSVNSESDATGFAITGLPTDEAKAKITEQLSAAGLGEEAINYKLRDWLFSRQRYWGEPFPVIHCDACGPQLIDESELPLILPELDEYKPTGNPEPLLARAEQWKQAVCPACDQPAVRELNTMPQWAGSCWYYLRYLDPDNDRALVDPEKERYWMGPNGVDLYVGGAEHAVLHLLYARFWHKVLHDAGVVSTAEPFHKLINQGMILGQDGQKMSKSRGNVINPDDIIRDYGADSMRLYEMFMGPLEATKPWSMQGVEGVYRFLQRVWRLIVDRETGELAGRVSDGDGDPAVEKSLHRTIKKVGGDVDAFKFNTAISAMMEFVNDATAAEVLTRSQAERFVLVLAPFAPHIAEDLWSRLGHDESLAWHDWPTYDEAMLVETEIEMPVQVNGKLRGRITVPADADEESIKSAAHADPNVEAHLEGKAIRKVIVVPGKLINIVAN